MSHSIPELEQRLDDVKALVVRDAQRLDSSEHPRAARLFYLSLQQEQSELERKLHVAKSERAYEVLRVRLMGNQLSNGTIPLRLLARLAAPLNSALELASWRVWDREGDATRIDDKFIRMLDLRLAGINSGSAELVLVGNVAPDLTGHSALETALQRVFGLLRSDADDMPEFVNDVGIRAARSIGELMTIFEREHLAADATWTAPGAQHHEWHGRPDEITRVRVLLDDIGEPEVIEEVVSGEVLLLSVSGRMVVRQLNLDDKLKISFPKALIEQVSPLRLGDHRKFLLQRTTYLMSATKRKRNAYRLLGVLDD